MRVPDVRKETTMGYKGERQRRNDRRLNGASRNGATCFEQSIEN